VYQVWIHLDHLIRDWIFATISKNHVVEVRDLIHRQPIWQRLESHFNASSLACALDLKRMLSNLNNLESQSMEEYLYLIKSIIDSLAAIQCPVSDLDLIQYAFNGLGSDYDNFVDNFSFLPGGISFDEI